MAPAQPTPSTTFRKKPILTPLKDYGISPRVWKTDATAKGFEAISDDTIKPRTRDRPKSYLPRNFARAAGWIKTLVNRYREVHTDDGTDDFSTLAHRRHFEAWDRRRQEKHEAKRWREDSRRRGRRDRKRTVSMEDELKHRGANPRTGVVSPSEMTEGSAKSGKENCAAREMTRNVGSGKWKQDHAGWRFEDSPLPNYNPQDLGENPTHGISTRELQDKFVVEMPGVDNPEPAEMTIAEIEMVQEWLQKGGDADHFPLYQKNWAQEQPSTQPNRYQRIPRKEVGSGLVRRRGSTDTVIVRDSICDSRSLAPRREISSDRGSTQSPTPASTEPQRSPSGRKSRSYHQRNLTDRLTDHMMNKTGCSPLPTIDQVINHPFDVQMQRSSAVLPPLSQPLSNYLPHIRLPHPTHFANLTTTYCRPRKLLHSLSKASQKQPTDPKSHSAQTDKDLIVAGVPTLDQGIREGREQAETQATAPIRSYSTPKQSRSSAVFKSILKKSQSQGGANVPREPLEAQSACIRSPENQDRKKHKEASGQRTTAIAKFKQLSTRNLVNSSALDTKCSEQVPGQLEMMGDDNIRDGKDEKGLNYHLCNISTEKIIVYVWKGVIWLRDSITIASVLHRLMQMIHQTLSVSSPPFKALRTANVMAGEYLSAIKAVFMAVVYLLVLFKILRLAAEIVWAPLRMMGIVAWWLAFS